ncbi:MAG: hypothetical protein BECKG1743E_GA0114224_111391, partial [Candidatus Kentron sp. G]
MQTIEFEAMIDEGGNVRLPERCQHLYGHQVRFVVSPAKLSATGTVPPETIQGTHEISGQWDRLLNRTRNIWHGGDGLTYQLAMREEWARDWNCYVLRNSRDIAPRSGMGAGWRSWSL